MRVTIKKIAEEAGVSVTTVSNVINKKAHRVSAEKIQLINQIIDKYHYTPNMNARALVQSSSSLIGVLYYSEIEQTNFSDPFVAEVLDGIEKKARELGYFILVHSVTSVADVEALQRNWKFEGFIAVSIIEEFFDDFEQKINAPIVFIDTHLAEKQIEGLKTKQQRFFINTDNYQAAMVATNYLIENGHESIAFFSYPFKKNVAGVIQERFKGYQAALKQHQLTYNTKQLYTDKQLPKLAKNLQDYSAIITTADFLSIELIHYLKEQQLYAKKNISIISFDDIRYARLSDPPLTTIKLDQIEKGELAVESLTKMIQAKDSEAPIILNLPFELIVRDSVHKKVHLDE
ncbi:LacI family DNA-binding transcriptional regulator [Enterococcus sp. LJL99]